MLPRNVQAAQLIEKYSALEFRILGVLGVLRQIQPIWNFPDVE